MRIHVRALVACRLGRRAGCVESLDHRLEGHPQDRPDPDAGALAQALRRAERRRGPDLVSSGESNRGKALELMARYADALRAYDEALNLSPEQSEIKEDRELCQVKLEKRIGLA